MKSERRRTWLRSIVLASMSGHLRAEEVLWEMGARTRADRRRLYPEILAIGGEILRERQAQIDALQRRADIDDETD